MENQQRNDSGNYEPDNTPSPPHTEIPADTKPQPTPTSEYEWQRPDYESEKADNKPFWLIPVTVVAAVVIFLFFRQRRKKQGLAAFKQQIETTVGDVSEQVDLEQTLKDLEKATGKSRKVVQRIIKDAGKQLAEIDLEQSKKDLQKAQGKSQKVLKQLIRDAGKQLEDLQGQIDVKGTKKELGKAQGKYGKVLKAFGEEAQKQLADLADQRRQTMKTVGDSGQQTLEQLRDLQDNTSKHIGKEQERLADVLAEVRDQLARLEERTGHLVDQVHGRYDDVSLDLEIARKRAELGVLETKRQVHGLSDFSLN
ncbi:MAG: hypothetical protein EXR62_08970 [Chloroflexi bacterium]|nr:hypothetical protein [Chloroflexota bacterium]